MSVYQQGDKNYEFDIDSDTTSPVTAKAQFPRLTCSLALWLTEGRLNINVKAALQIKYPAGHC